MEYLDKKQGSSNYGYEISHISHITFKKNERKLALIKINKKYGKNHEINKYQCKNKVNGIKYLKCNYANHIPIKMKYKHYFILIIYYLILLTSIYKYKAIDSRKMQQSSEITIMIKETGQQQIFYSSFSPKPNNITINGNLQNTINSKYNMNTPNSNITMIWNSKLKDCSYMFNECKQIVKINFSNFDSSEVTTMEKMFYNCRGLIKINFKNFNTSRVKNMNDMFAFCSSLTSLDLSSFDTSSVTEMMNMFSNCER